MSVILSLSFFFAHRCRCPPLVGPLPLALPLLKPLLRLVVDSDPNAVPVRMVPRPDKAWRLGTMPWLLL